MHAVRDLCVIGVAKSHAAAHLGAIADKSMQSTFALLRFRRLKPVHFYILTSLGGLQSLRRADAKTLESRLRTNAVFAESESGQAAIHAALYAGWDDFENYCQVSQCSHDIAFTSHHLTAYLCCVDVVHTSYQLMVCFHPCM